MGDDPEDPADPVEGEEGAANGDEGVAASPEKMDGNARPSLLGVQLKSMLWKNRIMVRRQPTMLLREVSRFASLPPSPTPHPPCAAGLRFDYSSLPFC